MSIHKTPILALLCLAGTNFNLYAQQESLRADEVNALAKRVSVLEQKARLHEGLRISGYIQMYYQTGEPEARLTIGGKQEDDHKSYSRMGIRRGRAKISYSKGVATGVL